MLALGNAVITEGFTAGLCHSCGTKESSFSQVLPVPTRPWIRMASITCLVMQALNTTLPVYEASQCPSDTFACPLGRNYTLA